MGGFFLVIILTPYIIADFSVCGGDWREKSKESRSSP
jgi:hypothetical protein